MSWKYIYDCPNCCETHWASVQGDWFCDVCGTPLDLRQPKDSAPTAPQLASGSSGTGNSGNDGTIWDE